MYATWARAIRSAALRAPRPRVATRRGRRHLHGSAPSRAAVPPSAPAPAAPGAPPRGAGDDATDPGSSGGAPPADESGKGESSGGGGGGGPPPAPDRDENLFGEGGLNSAGEARLGRQKRVVGAAARSQSSRSNAQVALPPVQIPGVFPKRRVFHWDKGTESGGFYWRATTLREVPKDVREDASKHLKQMIEGKPFHDAPTVRHGYHDIFEAAAWSDAEVQEFRENPQDFDAASVSHRGYAMLMSAMMILLEHQPGVGDSEAADVALEDREKLGELLLKWADEIGESSDSTSALKWFELYRHLERVHSPGWRHEARLAYLKDRFHSKLRFHSSLGFLHHDSLLEATSSIRAELALTAPSGMKAAQLKRPATVINFPYCSGDSWPRAVVQNIAVELQADVLHLTSQDIAHIVGSYVGQNTTRTPGPIAMLGYKAAENAGRIQPPAVEQNDATSALISPLSIVIPTDKMRKDGKKKMSIMDHLIGEPSRAKPDMWEDLKIHAALEEVIHTAESDAPEQRPLIVHLHDFNAVNMEEQGGAAVLGKLRKVVDTLWCEGRRIVLLGTCSSRRAPAFYVSALKDLKATERFVTLHPNDKIWPAEKDTNALQSDGSEGSNIVTAINSLEAKDFSDENATNISTMLNTLLALDDPAKAPEAPSYLHSWEAHQTLKTLSDRVLPASEVYRIATTMIGIRRRKSDAFDRSIVLEALRLVSLVDEGKENLAKSNSGAENDFRRNMMGGSSSSGLSGDHEERFASALVDPKDIRTTFNDIHAPQETIDSIKMLTQLSLLRPEAFTYGVLSTDRIPGCLLYGPPGTGKTLLAKAVAKESGANMVEVSGASINHMYVGESEKNIRALFNLAKKKEPLVIFIDEADALLGARGGRNDAAGRRSIINQFLREWDGMDATKAFIMVATNRPFDLDEAVLRRLPRKLLVDLPLEKDRAAILRIHLRGETLDESVSIDQMAKQTPLYSGSDLKNVCVAAAMAAVKEELEAAEKHKGPTPYAFPERRVLSRRHFDRGLAEIPASVSEDMATLSAIKKFDERYGERGARRKRRGMGFEVMPEATDSHEVRVREPGR